MTHWKNRIVGVGEADPEQLQANPWNWRIHPRAQAEALLEVLDRVGWAAPVIVNRVTGHVVDGHLRVTLALRRGEKRVPVQYVELTEDEERLVLATLDPLAGLAVADDEQLAALVEAVREELGAMDAVRAALEYDALLVGGSVGGPGGEDMDEPGEDEAETLVTKWGVESGQVWRIPSRSVLGGEHRLVVGDAFDVAVMEALLQGERVALVFTDPPYAIYGSSTGVSADVADVKMVIPFFREVGRVIRQSARRFAHVYICCDWRSYPVLWQAVREAGLTVKNMIVWDKGSSGLGGMYANTHELILFAVNHRQATTIAGAKRDRGQRQVHDTNVWRISREYKKLHNAQKPLELVERALRNSSDEGEVVLDPFLGSGTTLAACERMGRLGRGVEIEPRFAAVALERLARLGLEPEVAGAVTRGTGAQDGEDEVK